MREDPNQLFPGRPNYTGPKTGMFGLLHHRKLCEYSHDVMERVEYVKREKPEHEIAIRLHNMIYLGSCPTAAKRDTLYAALTQAKRDTLDAEIIAYIRERIPDCAWNGTELIFPEE
mgnify:CR=1 FL=1